MTQIMVGMKLEHLRRRQMDWKKYNIKLNNLAKVLPIIGSDVTNSHPAILGLCEVENKQVLIDLVSTENEDLNYGIIHFDSKIGEVLMSHCFLIQLNLSPEKQKLIL